ncbi:MAG: monofunctional biosynthetic peptidoglycan transglycosylase [Vicinamibacteria bacterium]|jgi:monofunctional biosynthetic peptidoglycan transglycosylase|nr:monofunctional biosynthetic peptidoglycan transglycosylase [Vicinamibacteria bacterium]
MKARRLRQRLKLCAIVAIALAVLYTGFVFWGLPRRADVRALAKTNPEVTGVMRQRADEAARAGRKLRRLQQWIRLNRVSRHLIRAVVAAEDPKFFGHEGIDWEALRESIETDIKKRRFARGGSTITQQLAKNLFFTTYKSLTRKAREFLVTQWLEDDLSKARILELYLNVIEWGDGVYGCEAAARRYYGKSAADLSAEEAAGLAAMIPSPRRINPRINPARHARAQQRILMQMARLGFIARETARLGSLPSPEPIDDGPEPNEPDEP